MERGCIFSLVFRRRGLCDGDVAASDCPLLHINNFRTYYPATLGQKSG